MHRIVFSEVADGDHRLFFHCQAVREMADESNARAGCTSGGPARASKDQIRN
jgi:hypothetical protein